MSQKAPMLPMSDLHIGPTLKNTSNLCMVFIASNGQRLPSIPFAFFCAMVMILAATEGKMGTVQRNSMTAMAKWQRNAGNQA